MPIRAVVFDIGSVLELVEDPADSAWTRKWRDRLGLTPEAYRSAVGTVDPQGRIATGGMSEEDICSGYAAALSLTPGQAAEFMADLWDWYCGVLDAELTAFAASLRPRCKVAILSNSADGARREEMARYAFDEIFDPVIYSHEVGLAKPDPAIFRLTCTRVGVAPGEMVFVDDHLENIQAARRAGIHVVHHQDTPETIAAVTALISGAF